MFFPQLQIGLGSSMQGKFKCTLYLTRKHFTYSFEFGIVSMKIFQYTDFLFPGVAESEIGIVHL
jgi:hypothetical protein